MKRRTTWIIVGSAVVLILAVSLFFRSGGDGDFQGDGPAIYLYDTNSGSLIEGTVDQVPRINEQPARVWATVLTCDTCSEDERYVGYLEMFGGQLASQLESATTRDMARSFIARHQGPESDYMVKRPDDAEWVPGSSDAGQTIISESRQKCATGSARTCYP